MTSIFRAAVYRAILNNGLITLAYFFAGLFSIFLLPISSHATSVWPPAGIALGALLIKGVAGLPGVFLGALGTNAVHAIVLGNGGGLGDGLVMALPMAAAAALQAYASLLLIEHWLGASLDLSKPKSVIAFLLLGGPIGCLVSSTLSVACLFLFGKLPLGDLPASWLTWWGGDVMGIITVTPVMLAMFASPRDLWRKRTRLITVPLLISLLMVLMAFYQNYTTEKSTSKSNFKIDAESLVDDLNLGMVNYAKVLKTLGAFYVTSEKDFNIEKFSEFTGNLLPLYPGMQALSWNQMVLGQEKSQFEKKMAKSGFPGFVITEMVNGQRMAQSTLKPFYFPVTFIEPIDKNLSAIGFDISSDPVRLKGMESAMRSGDVAATDPVELVQDGSGQAGVLFVYPIKNPQDTRIMASGDQSIAGFMVAVIRIEDMIDTIVGARLRSKHIDLHVDDARGRNMYDALRPNIKKYTEFAHVESLHGVKGASWIVSVIPTEAYFLQMGELNSRIVLIGGLLFTGLLGTFLLVLMGRNEMLTHETLEKLKTQAALASAEARKAATLEASLDAIIAMDKLGRIVDFNPSAERMFGYTRDEILGQDLAEKIIPERYREAHNAGVQRFLTTGIPRVIGLRMEVSAIKADGSEFPIEISPVPLNVNGEIFFTGVVRDITERRMLEEKLKAAKDSAEAANASKSAFLANMSHEIRTPLGAVLGFSELISSPTITNDERQRYLEIIKRNGALLSNVINDILDLSKVEAGKVEIDVQPTYVKDLLLDIKSFLDLQAREKGIVLEVSADNTIPDLIYTDPLRLRQILLNIVGNAVKFTTSGRVAVRVSLGVVIDGAPCIELRVIDSGPGLTTEESSKLFQPFTQADVSTKRRYGGTGLGLALSRRLAALLGGDVVLEHSEVGKGSTFLVRISANLGGKGSRNLKLMVPKKAVEPVAQRPTVDRTAHAAISNLRLQNRRILVAEDAPDNRLLIGSILTVAGAKVDMVENGSEAFEKVHANEYDAVLMDLQMPVMDGYEATRSLRHAGFTLPIIALTAHALREEEEKCREVGFTAHLAKPINIEILINTLSAICSNHNRL